ncbi:MAG: glycosyltransferase family 4 protein [Nitrososphaeria archaeon]
MKVVMLTGSYPPDRCGVGDYTFRLVNALRDKGVNIYVIKKGGWHLDWTTFLLDIKKINPDIIHIQYPTIGFGWSLAPQLVSLLMPCVVTLHEVSQVHILRKLSLFFFTIRGRYFIFTSEFERQYAISKAPWISRKSSVIPIGSNIPVSSEEKLKNSNEIVYFGLFRPKRGIENVLALADYIKQRGMNLSVHMIGQPQLGQENYFQDLQRRAENLPVKWSVALSDYEVANLLAKSKVAYIPYPDGASERRTSLLALLANGVVPITTKGKYTSPELENVVLYAKTPEEALEVAIRLIQDNLLYSQLAEAGRNYAQKFTWESIAVKHLDIYTKLVKNNN